MHILFRMPNGLALELAEQCFELELRKWTSRHNIDYHSLTHYYTRYEGVVKLFMPNDRVLELFCLSWCPKQEYFKDYVLRKNV